MKKTGLTVLSVLLVLSLLTVSVFAAGSTAEKQGLCAWLQNADNTGFDYSETSFADGTVDWSAFALARSFADVPKEYPAYINAVVENTFAGLYPSDIARITLSATACGLDPRSVGGHDLLAALSSVDYTKQTYLSSLIFPLIAMNFRSDFGFSDEVKADIVKTILAAQLSDGGFPYSTEDSGYGVTSDTDTTSMAVQALAPYYKTDDAVRAAVDKALDYLLTQQFDDGSFGYTAWGSKSGESTAQVILALCALGLDPTDARFVKNGKTPVDALKTYIGENGGAWYLDYQSGKPVENALSTYQVLMGLEAYDRFVSGAPAIYTYDEKPQAPETTEPTTTPETTAPQTTEPATENKENVEIPKTGAATVPVGAAVLLLGAAATVLFVKKDER